MKFLQNEGIIYSLNVNDIQNVSNQELGRKLTIKEIENIIDSIAGNINWYDAISHAINEKYS